MEIKKIVMVIVMFLLLSTGVFAVERTLFLDDYQIQYSYDNAEDGERFTLQVEVTNTGSTKEDIVLRLYDSNPFDVKSDTKWEIGTLDKDQSVTRTFRIDVKKYTPEDEYGLDFRLEDSEDDYDDEFEIDTVFKYAELIIADINSEPPIISADQTDVKLTFKVDNIGSSDANFVVAKLGLPDGFSSSSSYSDSANAGIIEAKGSTDLVFFIDTAKSLASGSHTGALNVQYQSDNQHITRTLSFDLPVKGNPLFQLVSAGPGSTPAGGSGQLSIRIRNIGEETGEETSVRVFENSDLPLEFDQKTNLIGTLYTGEEGTATFIFKVDTDAIPKKYIVKAQVRTVNNGNVIVDEFSVPLTITAPVKKVNFGLILGIVLIGLLAIIFYLFYIIRKN
jgi:uncharacterized membrane protein